MKTVKVILELHKKQLRFLSLNTRTVGYVGGRGAGKSYAGVVWLYREAQRPGRYIALSPTFSMARDSLIPTLHEVGNLLGVIRSVQNSPSRFHLVNGSTITVRTGLRPAFLRSGSYSACLMDEAAFMSPLAFKIVFAAMREYGRPGRIALCSTPKGKGNWLFTRLATGQPNTSMVTATSWDNPYIEAEQHQSLAKEYDEILRQQEVEGKFVSEDEATQVIPSLWVEQAQLRYKNIITTPPLDALGVDVAYGAGRTVFAHRHHHIITRLSIYPGSSTPNAQGVVDRIVPILNHSPHTLVNIDITEGHGREVLYRLKETLPSTRANGVNFASKTERTLANQKFRNVRAHMYWSLREALNPEGSFQLILPENIELLSELTAAHCSYTASGVVLEDKERISKELGRSPDLADAVALTMVA